MSATHDDGGSLSSSVGKETDPSGEEEMPAAASVATGEVVAAAEAGEQQQQEPLTTPDNENAEAVLTAPEQAAPAPAATGEGGVDMHNTEPQAEPAAEPAAWSGDQLVGSGCSGDADSVLEFDLAL